MPLIEERYDQHKIDSLKRYLQREADKGRARDYEIIIDGFKVVSRTDDVAEFDDYENEITDSTRNISILIYDGDRTPRNTKYSFALNQESIIAQHPQNGLGSLADIDEKIQHKMDEKEKDFRIATLTTKLEEAEEKLAEAEEYAEKLKAEVEYIKANRFKVKDLNLLEVGAELLKYTVAKNANKSPLAAQINGILGAISAADQPVALPQQTTPAQDTECEVNTQQPGKTGEFTETQLLILTSIQQMEQVFTAQQLPIVNGVLIKLMENPDQLLPVAELLNVKTNNEHGKV